MDLIDDLNMIKVVSSVDRSVLIISFYDVSVLVFSYIVAFTLKDVSCHCYSEYF